MRTFELTTERVRIGDLEVGMRLGENLCCIRPNCKKHASGNRMIGSEMYKGRELTEFDIIHINREYECLYTSGFRAFESKKDILEFLEGHGKTKAEVYTVIIVDRDFHELRTETLSSLYRIANEVDAKKGLKVKISAEQEYLFLVQRPTEKKREYKSFLKKLKGQIKSVYNEVEEAGAGDKALPVTLILDTYETIKNSRAIFEKIANTTMMRDLQNDARDSLYDGIHNHIYNVALTSAKIVFNMDYGKNAHLEQVFSSCIFLDIGIPLSRKAGGSLDQHTILGSKFFEFYLKKVEQANAERVKSRGPDAVSAVAIDNNTMMNLKMGKTLIEYHHERMDGSGYPYKLKEFQRTQEMDRLVAIVDEFYRLTGTVDYHMNPPCENKPLTRAEALDVLSKKVKASLFDARMFEVFKKHVQLYPLYSFVLLDGERKAVVTRLPMNSDERPVVFALDEGVEIDLSHAENSSIAISPDMEHVPKLYKGRVGVDIMIRKKKNAIKIALDDGYVCPRCKKEIDGGLPEEIGDEFSLNECLVERKAMRVCPDGHFCLIYIEPPENCDLIRCKQGENCSADWNVYVEGF